MEILTVVITMVLGYIIWSLCDKLEEIKKENEVLLTERKNTRRVMYENGLIPKEYLK